MTSYFLILLMRSPIVPNTRMINFGLCTCRRLSARCMGVADRNLYL